MGRTRLARMDQNIGTHYVAERESASLRAMNIASYSYSSWHNVLNRHDRAGMSRNSKVVWHAKVLFCFVWGSLGHMRAPTVNTCIWVQLSRMIQLHLSSIGLIRCKYHSHEVFYPANKSNRRSSARWQRSFAVSHWSQLNCTMMQGV